MYEMILVAAVVVVLYALHLGRNVKLSFTLPGTTAALEVNGSTRQQLQRDRFRCESKTGPRQSAS